MNRGGGGGGCHCKSKKPLNDRRTRCMKINLASRARSESIHAKLLDKLSFRFSLAELAYPTWWIRTHFEDLQERKGKGTVNTFLINTFTATSSTSLHFAHSNASRVLFHRKRKEARERERQREKRRRECIQGPRAALSFFSKMAPRVPSSRLSSSHRLKENGRLAFHGRNFISTGWLS